MEPKFNINRPKISDDEIKKHQDFEKLVKQFKQQSLDKAKHDKSWWKSKKVRYSAVIAGITVICTISYLTLFKNETKQNTKYDTITTQPIAQQTKPTKKKYISEPSANLKVNYASYKINNAKGGEIKHPTSSKITVPKNTFVDKNGKDIIGDVTIEYREFHDVADIIVAGIPMAYDSAGTKYNLESAGMFDIKGSQNGQPVFIKPDKKVEVSLASTNSENRFNQYYLDTVAENWQYLKRDDKLSAIKTENKHSEKLSDNKANSKLQILKNQIEVVIPKKIDSVQIVYKKKTEALPIAKEPKKINKPTPGRPTFYLEGSYNEFPELAAFDNVVFEVGPENKNYRKEMHEITWSDVKVSEGPIKGKNYLLTLSYRSQAEKLIVYPTLTGENFDKAEKKYQKKFAEYEAMVEKRDADEKRLMAEMEAKQKAYLTDIAKKKEEYAKERRLLEDRSAAIDQKNLENSFSSLSNNVKALRAFSISKFGIYNSDCPHGMQAGKSVTPIFVLDDNSNFINPDAIFIVDHNTKMVLTVSAKDGFKINYDPFNSYSICIFKNTKLYVCNKVAFRSAVDSDGNKFLISEIVESKDNLFDLKKALEII